MSIYLIAFISAVVLYVALIVTTCYMEYCLGKRYELMRGVSEILECAVFLTFGWWFLERFSSGFDSGFGWWLFAFALGLAISLYIRIATNRICERIWFKGERAGITTVKVQKVQSPFFLPLMTLVRNKLVYSCQITGNVRT